MALKSFKTNTLNTVGDVNGLVHIETQNPSGVASVSFNNVFSSNFTNYLITGSWTMSEVGDILFRLRAGGTDLTSSSYRWTRFYYGVTNATTLTTQINQTATGFTIGRGDVRSGYIMQVYSPFIAQHTSWQQQQTGSFLTYTAGRVENTTSYDGFSLVDGGNYTGTISVYGYKEA